MTRIDDHTKKLINVHRVPYNYCNLSRRDLEPAVTAKLMLNTHTIIPPSHQLALVVQRVCDARKTCGVQVQQPDGTKTIACLRRRSPQ